MANTALFHSGRSNKNNKHPKKRLKTIKKTNNVNCPEGTIRKVYDKCPEGYEEDYLNPDCCEEYIQPSQRKKSDYNKYHNYSNMSGKKSMKNYFPFNNNYSKKFVERQKQIDKKERKKMRAERRRQRIASFMRREKEIGEELKLVIPERLKKLQKNEEKRKERELEEKFKRERQGHTPPLFNSPVKYDRSPLPSPSNDFFPVPSLPKNNPKYVTIKSKKRKYSKNDSSSNESNSNKSGNENGNENGDGENEIEIEDFFAEGFATPPDGKERPREATPRPRRPESIYVSSPKTPPRRVNNNGLLISPLSPVPPVGVYRMTSRVRPHTSSNNSKGSPKTRRRKSNNKNKK